ncbi:hypothetical protein [Spongiimicrobium salis]|uniref:hypothetical protein n=1 Tax=Spongiimicrobium salis TaxID=1667022 RepID=UPI00374CC0BF
MKKLVTLLIIMGFFSKLFGQTEKQNPESVYEQELRLEYNIMKNISLEKSSKYADTSKYRFIEEGIYEDLNDDSEQKYRMILSYELALDESNNQYPLEDILDKYLLHISDFLENENDANPNTYRYEFGGFLDGMRKAKELIGKRVFNREYRNEEGQILVQLVIE